MNPTSQAAPRARQLVGVAILFVLGSCVKRKLPAPGVAIGPAEPMYPIPALAGAAEDDAAASAAWTVEVAEGGTLRVNFRGAQVLSFHYLFWGPNFSWANPVVTNARTTGGVTTFDLVVDALGLKIAGKMAKSGPGEMSIEFGVVAEKQVSDITGGGLEFNLNLDAAVPGKGNAPSLLLDRRGFKWEAGAADAAAKSYPSGYSTPSGVPQRLAAARSGSGGGRAVVLRRHLSHFRKDEQEGVKFGRDLSSSCENSEGRRDGAKVHGAAASVATTDSTFAISSSVKSYRRKTSASRRASRSPRRA